MDKIRLQSMQSFDKHSSSFDTSTFGSHARGLYPHMLRELERARFASILDVGCGTGALLSEVPAQVRRAGLDLSPKMVALARRRLGNAVEVRTGDAERLPWPTASFNVVMCSDSFHHYPHPDWVLAEMHRVMERGGRLILADVWAPMPVRQVVNLTLPLIRTGDVRVRSKGEIVRLLDGASFRDISWRRLNVLSCIVTAAK